METAKIFNTNEGQTIRLPAGLMLEGNEVFVKKVGRNILLIPKDDPWEALISSLDQFSEDFMEERNQQPVQNREDI